MSGNRVERAALGFDGTRLQDDRSSRRIEYRGDPPRELDWVWCAGPSAGSPMGKCLTSKMIGRRGHKRIGFSEMGGPGALYSLLWIHPMGPHRGNDIGSHLRPRCGRSGSPISRCMQPLSISRGSGRDCFSWTWAERNSGQCGGESLGSRRQRQHMPSPPTDSPMESIESMYIHPAVIAHMPMWATRVDLRLA